MDYSFSFGSFFFGVFILIIGILFMAFHQAIANSLGGRVASYERFKLYALIVCGVGIAVALNIHLMLLNWLFNSLFKRG